MKKLMFAAAIAMLPAVAQATSYKCETKNFGRGGWVPSELVLAYDAEAGVGSAYGPMINAIHKAPIPVEWKQRSATSSEFRWKLKGLKASNGGKGINSFKVVLFEKRNAFTLSGRRHGYDNVISGSGTCRKID